jgi:hypothetical protein
MKTKNAIIFLSVFFSIVIPSIVNADCASDCRASGNTGAALATCLGNCELANSVEVTRCCVDDSDKSKCGETLSASCPSGYAFQSKKCDEISSCKTITSEYSGTAASTPTTFINPLGSVTTVSGLLSNVLNNLRGILVIIAVTFIVLGGLMYMLSGGNEKMVTRAKNIWTGAIIGLAIALAAPTFLKQIQLILGGGGGGESAESWVSNALTVREIAVNVLKFLMSIFGIVAIASMIISGGMLLTAYGDEKRVETGKKIITYAVIGIVVALSGVVILRQVGALIGG